MRLFRRKHDITDKQHDTRVDVVVQKEVNRAVFQQASEAGQELNNTLDRNGFTIKIFLAAGGKSPVQKQKGAR